MASPQTYNPSLDGYILYEPGSTTWAGMKAATDGTSHDDTASSASALYVRQNGGSPNYDIGLRRSGFLFDSTSSPIPSNATITSITFSFFHNSHGNTIGGTPGVVLVSFNPASTSAIADADYDQFGSTAYSDVVLLSSMTNSSRVTLTLNASGIAAFVKNGISKYGMIFEEDRANAEPTWTGNFNEWYVNFCFNEAGGTSKPELTVTYTLPGSDKMLLVF